MMKGAPRLRAAMRKRVALGGSAARCCYRFCYILMVLAAVGAVFSRLRGAGISAIVNSNTGAQVGSSRRGSGGDRASLMTAQESSVEMKKEHLRRWVKKPNSLCFGRGNITILSVAIDLPQDYLELLRSNRLVYAGIHNYRYCEVGTKLDYTRHAHWTKVKATSLLLSFADIVMHIDADALIVNHSIPVESILDSAPFNASEKDVVYTSDFTLSQEGEMDSKTAISSAVYIIRSTEWSKSLLETEHKLDRDSSLFKKYDEQDALNLYRKKNSEEYSQHVGVIPFRQMNSPCSENYNFYELGDFIVHFAEGHSAEKYHRLAARFMAVNPRGKSCSTCECLLRTTDLRQ